MKVVTTPITTAVKVLDPEGKKQLCNDPALTTHPDLLTRAFFAYAGLICTNLN